VNATGVVIYTEENLIRIGQTPPEEALPDLIVWLENQFEQDLFATHSLPKIYPAAIAFKEVASGLLALSITKVQKNYVLWFRPEILQEVNWAGKPEKVNNLEEDGTETLSPRKSFKGQKINNLCVLAVLRNGFVIPFRKIVIKNNR
jgi:light-regulated signal transduction histidine kinase (bacteriophytochrome)